MSEELIKNRKKRYYTLRDLITGWAVVLKSKTTSKRGRTKIATYFIQQVKSVKLWKSNVVIIESDYPIYVEKNWEDVSPRMSLIKLDKAEIKINIDGVDLDNITLTESFFSELREYINKRLEEVIKSKGDTSIEEDNGDSEIF